MRADLRAHIEAAGQSEKMLYDPPFKFGMDILSEVLDCAEVAMRTERIEPDVVRRVLNTLIYGVSTPDAVMAEQLQRVHLIDAADLDLVTLMPKGWHHPDPQ